VNGASGRRLDVQNPSALILLRLGSLFVIITDYLFHDTSERDAR
jgi:hypothetical protein